MGWGGIRVIFFVGIRTICRQQHGDSHRAAVSIYGGKKGPPDQRCGLSARASRCLRTTLLLPGACVSFVPAGVLICMFSPTRHRPVQTFTGHLILGELPILDAAT